MFTRTLSLVLAASALLVTGSCDSELREHSETGGTQQASANPVLPDVGTTSLLQGMMTAPQTTLLQGIRRFEAHWKVGGQLQHLVYREQLSCDGLGRFSVDPLETIDPELGGGQESLFFLLQKHREGFMFGHRDLMVRDLDLFFSNYQVVDLGVTTTVAGRSCAQLDIQRQLGAKSIYHLAIDLQTGMLLRSAEESLVDGSLIALIEFESLDDMPDFTGQVWHQPKSSSSSSQPSKMNRLEYLGGARPKLLPPGYQLLESDLIADAAGSESWVRYIYSDGLQELFFLTATTTGPMQTAAGTTPNPGPTTDEVRVLDVGPWNVVQGSVFGADVIVMGATPVTGLLDMIESAFN